MLGKGQRFNSCGQVPWYCLHMCNINVGIYDERQRRAVKGMIIPT